MSEGRSKTRRSPALSSAAKRSIRIVRHSRTGFRSFMWRDRNKDHNELIWAKRGTLIGGTIRFRFGRDGNLAPDDEDHGAVILRQQSARP
jgi:hypothetical protein